MIPPVSTAETRHLSESLIIVVKVETVVACLPISPVTAKFRDSSADPVLCRFLKHEAAILSSYNLVDASSSGIRVSARQTGYIQALWSRSAVLDVCLVNESI